MTEYGKVSLVGAGPGDRGLITLKGMDCVRQADVIIYDSLISASILNEARLNAELIYAGKRSSHHHLRQEETNALLVEKAKEGKYVVRLKGGDPFIFGRGGEEAAELAGNGIPFEIVPGISSSYSAAAYAGIPVTERGTASSFHVITGHESDEKGVNVIHYDTLAREEGTLVFLMGLANLPVIAKELIRNGKPADTPAAVIGNGTTARQQVCVGTLADIARKAGEQKIAAPAVTVIGSVVSLREIIRWYGGRPLSGKRILITGTRAMAAGMMPVLEAQGAETVAMSLIETVPLPESELQELETAVKNIRNYAWIVFTSINGVRLFFDFCIKNGVDARNLANVRFAAIGAETRHSLEEHGYHADFMPSRFTGETFAEEWLSQTAGKTPDEIGQILLVRAKKAGSAIPDAFRKAGIRFTDAAVYHTVMDGRRAEDLNRLIGEMDYVTVASSSAADAFSEMLEDTGRLQELPVRVIAIGPVTAAECERKGIRVYRTAETYSAQGICDTILKDGGRQ
jgi:uroporphyrinogen III methyltransferase/synthase